MDKKRWRKRSEKHKYALGWWLGTRLLTHQAFRFLPDCSWISHIWHSAFPPSHLLLHIFQILPASIMSFLLPLSLSLSLRLFLSCHSSIPAFALSLLTACTKPFIFSSYLISSCNSSLPPTNHSFPNFPLLLVLPSPFLLHLSFCVSFLSI